MHRSQRHVLALGPGEIEVDVDTLWGEDGQMKYPRSFVIFFILT